MKIRCAVRIIPLLLLGVVACSEDSTGPDGSGGGVTIESNRAASKVVGPLDSTSITATGSTGASYTLTVPRLTARDTITYTVTPITSAGGVLGDAGFVAGVRLGPDGLRLNGPATLAIQLPAGTNVNALAGFVADDDGTDPVLVPVFVRDGKAVLLVDHFSTAGVVQLASSIPNPPDPDPAIDAIVRISLHIVARRAAGQAPDADTLAGHMRTWYTGLVKPLLVTAAGSAAGDSTTVAALAAEKTWSVYLIQLEQEPGMQFQLQTRLFNEMEELLPLVKNALRAAVLRNNQLCVEEDFNDAIRAINNVYYWYRHAWERSISSAPMDRETIDQELCVVTRTDSVGFVGDVAVGANVPLQVLAGLRFDDDPAPVYSLYTHVEVVPVSGASAVAGRPLMGDTDEDGVFVTELHIETSTVVVEVRTSLNPVDVWGEEYVAYNDTTLLVQPVAVDIEPDSIGVAPNGTQQFTAVVNGTTNQQVVWTTTQPGGTISGSGLFIASSTTGTYEVIASSVAHPGVADTATVAITSASVSAVTNGLQIQLAALTESTAPECVLDSIFTYPNVPASSPQQTCTIAGASAAGGWAWAIIGGTFAGPVTIAKSALVRGSFAGGLAPNRTSARAQVNYSNTITITGGPVTYHLTGVVRVTGHQGDDWPVWARVCLQRADNGSPCGAIEDALSGRIGFPSILTGPTVVELDRTGVLQPGVYTFLSTTSIGYNAPAPQGSESEAREATAEFDVQLTLSP